MAGFPASITLSGMSSSTGFRVGGEANADNLGFTVSSAGDVNGDGFEDFIVGAVWSDHGGADAGAAYVVFGTGGGFFPSNFSPSLLDGTNGFRIDGKAAGNMLGTAVGGGGDINGDGYDDIVVGAYAVGPYATGAAYVIFGHAGAFSPSISVTSLNGTNGFTLPGAARQDFTGASADIVGDVNGDGYDDIFVGAPYGIGILTDRGVGYLVFGHGGSFASSLSLSALNGTTGVQILGADSADLAGKSVSGAGDFNGDGLQDLIIGAPSARSGPGTTGAAYIVFGKGSGFSSTLDLGTLNGANGFKIAGATSGDQAGYSVAGAGDINGDGYDDVIIGAPGNSFSGSSAGAAYVVFGGPGVFAATLNLSSLNGTNGFRIIGSGSGGLLGRAAAGGDINGDGYADVIVGAPRTFSGATSGATYVIFGHSGAFTADFNVQTLNGANGLALNGPSNSFAGRSVGAADLNGDGADEVLVGAPTAPAPDGLSTPGAAFVLYGLPSVITWTGGAGDETRNGGSLGDTLNGGAGKDVLNGLGGADILNGDDGNDTLNGGDGTDTLHGGLNNDIVNGDAGDDQVYGDEGNDKVNGGDGADHLYGGDGADLMDGGTGDDVLDGGIGNDSLNGGTGADGMTGGAGNDVYYVDDAGDQTIEAAGEGTDIVRASISWTLSANIEQLELQGAANLDGAGNELTNRLTGNDGDNALSGLDGNDTILGGAGNDTIIGGRGNDLMTGGTGADTFAIQADSVYSSKTPAGGHLEIDFVYDLNAGEGDRLDLSAIDADSTAAGDQAFHLVGAFTKHGGEMTLAYSASANQTVLSLDVDGDGRADYQMKIAGDVHLESGGWIL